MSLYSYYRVSKPSAEIVPSGEVPGVYRRLRRRTFWGATAAYALYYVCRTTLGVVKQPLIDGGVLTAGQLGLVGSAMLFVYAIGKFSNGFIADYCNARKFMTTGILVSALLNLIVGVLGFVSGKLGSGIVFIVFGLLWGINGMVQSMGSPPGVISLSRWFPMRERGTFYSIFSSTPYIGQFLSYIIIGVVVSALGWQFGFLAAGIAGLAGAAVASLLMCDTPESCGLPSIQEISGEEIRPVDRKPTKEIQKMVLKSPGVWVIVLATAFIYIIQYAINDWGVLFLQKESGFSLVNANLVISFASAFGIVGTVCAGWISDRIFRGDRARPVLVSGIVCLLSLAAFIFLGGGLVVKIVLMSLFSLTVGIQHCIVAGLMAIDIVPRKATGAALGIVGLVSYGAAGLQEVVSGFLIQGGSLSGSYDFTPVAAFWLVSCLLSFVIPVLGWKKLGRVE